MSNTSKRIITASVLTLLVVSFLAYIIFTSQKVIVPEGTIGNTAGNLYNYGLFCEQDGYVYFSNSYDDGSLYRMTPDQKDIKKIYNMNAKYINAGGNHVFFFGKSNTTSSGLGSVVSKPGIYMITSEGEKTVSLSREATQNMLLVGSNLYYQSYNTTDLASFEVVNVKSQKREKLLDYFLEPSCYVNGLFYFNGQYEDHYLYSYNPATKEVATVWEGDCWNPIYDGNYVYYMDVMHNYRLCRYSISSNTIEVLTRERLDAFNVYENVIYYQVSSISSPALYRINTDGSNPVKIADGIFNNINITSTYTYFYEFGDERTIYCTPTFMSPDVTEFSAAKQAVFTK